MYSAQQKSSRGHPVSENRCPSFKAYFRLTPERRLRVFFLKRHLPHNVIQRHFGKGQFEMPFTFELPSILLLKLGIESYKIHPGSYPVQEDLDFLKIDF
jgi:hypothetical protein